MKNIFYENKSKPIILSHAKTLGALPHLHKEVEAIYVVKGRALAYADRARTEIKSGDLFVSFPNQVHYYTDVDKGEYYLMIISPDVLFGLKGLFNENVPKQNVLHVGNGSEEQKLFEKSIEEIKLPYGTTVAAGMLNQAFGRLFPRFELKLRIKSDNSTLHSILNYCNLNYATDITLDDAAEALHLSKYHISHLFNNKLGIGFNTYVNTLRVDKACDLLEETDKKTADISEETGFGSIRSFNRAFLQIMDMSPQQYRNKLKPKAEKD